ncbi:hypothetical protein [Nocardiopsis tropica]
MGPTPGGPLFAARLGVLACELAPQRPDLVAHLVSGALGSDDAHAATAVLGSVAVASQLASGQRRVLSERVEQAQFDLRNPSYETTHLTEVCDKAARALTRHLRHGR